jgi:hypothetical protein
MRNFVIASALAIAGIYGHKRRQRRSTAAAVRPPPGNPRRFEDRALAAGAALLQGRAPLAAMNTYLDAFHFENGELAHQAEVHHYCAQLTDDFIQCAVFDGDTPEARLIGVEYVISARLFRDLPEEEKPLWHSHRYEVTSGLLVAPGIPEPAEHRLMERIAGTYGKAWHTWRDTKEALPLGIPALMMVFTADGQIDPRLVQERDRRVGISTAARRDDRRDIAAPPPLSSADAWERGRVIQIRAEERRTPAPSAEEAAGPRR